MLDQESLESVELLLRRERVDGVLDLLVLVALALSALLLALRLFLLEAALLERRTAERHGADRLVELCKLGDGEHCHQAEKGKMCVSGPGNEAFCNFVWGWAGSQQSWHNDWFLWSDITCNGGVEGTGDDLHIRIL